MGFLGIYPPGIFYPAVVIVGLFFIGMVILFLKRRGKKEMDEEEMTTSRNQAGWFGERRKRHQTRGDA